MVTKHAQETVLTTKGTVEGQTLPKNPLNDNAFPLDHLLNDRNFSFVAHNVHIYKRKVSRARKTNCSSNKELLKLVHKHDVE